MNDDEQRAQVEYARRDFESIIKAPPYEHSAKRFPHNDKSTWPGQYVEILTQCMWEAWLIAKTGSLFGANM